MDKYLSHLFSFSCPDPHVSPGHSAGRSQDKTKVLCLGFQCHLMFTWHQHAPKVLLWLVPCTALWHLAVAIPPSQWWFASCSLQPHHPPLSVQLGLLAVPSPAFPCTQKQSQEEAALLSSCASSPACAASSSHHSYLWLTCAPTQGLFISLLVIHRVWGALQTNRSHNCSVLEQPPDDITMFALLCLLHQFVINFCVLLGSVF